MTPRVLRAHVDGRGLGWCGVGTRWYAVVWYGTVCYGWFGMAWDDMILIRCDMGGYMIWNGMGGLVWYGTVRYGVVWYGQVDHYRFGGGRVLAALVCSHLVDLLVHEASPEGMRPCIRSACNWYSSTGDCVHAYAYASGHDLESKEKWRTLSYASQLYLRVSIRARAQLLQQLATLRSTYQLAWPCGLDADRWQA